MKKHYLLVLIISFSLNCYSQITNHNEYTFNIKDFTSVNQTKPVIDGLRQVSNSNKCFFNEHNNSFHIKTTLQLSEHEFYTHLLKNGYTLLNFKQTHKTYTKYDIIISLDNTVSKKNITKATEKLIHLFNTKACFFSPTKQLYVIKTNSLYDINELSVKINHMGYTLTSPIEIINNSLTNN